MKSLLIIILLAVAANYFFATSPSAKITDSYPADTLKEIQPENYYVLENQLITTILSRYHYKKFEVDDSLSSIIFNSYINSLDIHKNYFLKSDITGFERERYKFDDYLLEGNIDPFYRIFNIFTQRMQSRVNHLYSLLENEFDFSADEEFEVNPENPRWAENEDELNELWRKRVKNDALNLKLTGKSWDEIVKNLSSRYENYSRLLSQYNSEDVFQIAMNAYSTSLDPHTNYLSPVTSENFKIDMSLSLEGIGARLMSSDGYTKIVEIIPGGPAFTSKKLRVDDRIVAVAQGDVGEFVDVIGWRITDVVQLIRGPKGSTVRLQILAAELGLEATAVEIVLVRDKVKLEDQSAQSKILEIENNGLPYKIGVITIPKFYTDFEAQLKGDKDFKSTTRDVSKLLEDLKSEKVDGVVIDLRDDGGGSLEEAIDVTGLFIKDGPVVQVRNSDGTIRVGRDLDSKIIYDGPLAVMVNRFSASASEIFAGAIQDYNRGLIIGEQTYGKGTVQNLIDLNRLASQPGIKLGQVKLTIAKYYRIDGSSTQHLGVIPDIQFPSFVDPDEFGESSEPTALPWDQIDGTDYKTYNDLSSIIPRLITSSKERINKNPEFDFINDDIEEYKLSREKRFISLNEDVRRKEKEAAEEKSFTRENERRKIKGLTLLKKGEVPPDEADQETDPYLDETSLILSDMIRISSDLTKVH